MNNEEAVVREVLEMWSQGPDGAKEAWRRHGAEDLEWWNSARGAIESLDGCLAAIDAMYEALDVHHVDAPIRRLTAGDGCVFVERSDDLYKADGTLIQAVPVVGVVEFEGGKIASWRDYTDDWILKMQQGG